jgi:hypothetical protein
MQNITVTFSNPAKRATIKGESIAGFYVHPTVQLKNDVVEYTKRGWVVTHPSGYSIGKVKTREQARKVAREIQPYFRGTMTWTNPDRIMAAVSNSGLVQKVKQAFIA